MMRGEQLRLPEFVRIAEALAPAGQGS
jgi:hypothetical protein